MADDVGDGKEDSCLLCLLVLCMWDFVAFPRVFVSCIIVRFSIVFKYLGVYCTVYVCRLLDRALFDICCVLLMRVWSS